MLHKTKAYVKRYDGQTKWMYFLIDVKVNKASCDIYKKDFWEPKQNFTMMKLQIFTMKNV